ncbi:hypothetical protein CUMW_188930 [Citrus unshiu]|nr:hypothetical protein CUMW_188930 [Citrus unshiu]
MGVIRILSRDINNANTNAFQDANTLGFLSSTQALADCAQLITDVKRNLSAENCPVIAIGGSYGGMLASWLRLKYPHIAIGALASSAPILYFDDLTPQNGYHVVANDFRDVSESCYNTIKQSWSEIDRVAGQTNELATWFRLKYPHIALGALASSAPVLYYEDITPHNEYYSTVTKNYRDTSETCYQNKTILESWAEIQRVGELPDVPRETKMSSGMPLPGMYTSTSQYGRPPENPIEKSVVSSTKQQQIAHAISINPRIELKPMMDGRGRELKKLFELENVKCQEVTLRNGGPMSVDEKTMLRPVNLFNLTEVIEQRQQLIINFALLHFYEKLQDIKLTLQRFTGNIIFSNGLRDPYSAGGVLKNISDSIIALPTVNGSHGLDIVKSNKTSDPDWLVQQRSHCLDILRANQDSDPDWLVMQRKAEVEIIEGWISKYYADLKAVQYRNCTQNKRKD